MKRDNVLVFDGRRQKKRSKSEKRKKPSVLLVFFVCLKRHTYIYIKKRNPLKKKDNVIITVRDNCLGTRERERERNRKKGDTRTHIEDFFSMPRKNRETRHNG